MSPLPRPSPLLLPAPVPPFPAAQDTLLSCAPFQSIPIQQKPSTLCPVKALPSCIPPGGPSLSPPLGSYPPPGFPTLSFSPAVLLQHHLCFSHHMSPCITYVLHHGSYRYQVLTTYYHPLPFNQRLTRPL